MQTLPITVRRAIELMGLYCLGLIVVVGKDVITPIIMAFFISIMLLPIQRALTKRKVPETLSIFIALLVMVIILALLLWFFSSQISNLVSDFPQIQKNVQAHIHNLGQWI